MLTLCPTPNLLDRDSFSGVSTFWMNYLQHPNHRVEHVAFSTPANSLYISGDNCDSFAPLVEVQQTHEDHNLDQTRKPLVPSPLAQAFQKQAFTLTGSWGWISERRSHPVTGCLSGFGSDSGVNALLSDMATFPELIQILS